MDADLRPAQTALPLDPPERCRRCGADWPGILREDSADLVALMKLPADERERFLRCWTGKCGRDR